MPPGHTLSLIAFQQHHFLLFFDPLMASGPFLLCKYGKWKAIALLAALSYYLCVMSSFPSTLFHSSLLSFLQDEC